MIGSLFSGIKLFAVLSGGLVISKPAAVAMINGQLMYGKDKQYVCLGIYSGEYYHEKEENASDILREDYGLSIVLYSP